jgi:agmatinase
MNYPTEKIRFMEISQPKIPFAGCFATDSENQINSKLVFVGLPDDQQSSYLKGCAQAPNIIRDAYDGYSYNSTTDSGIDLAASVIDLGDWLPENSGDLTVESYYQQARSLFLAGKIPFFAGGDHAVTIPIGKALDTLGQPIHIIQIDAHPDMYPEMGGSIYSHACVASRLLEYDHIASITQIGIRTMNRVQQEVVDKFSDRLHLFPARELSEKLPSLSHIPIGAPVYLTIDLDGIDPAFAPGVSHPVPGGLSSRQVLNLIQQGHWRLVGMDVVELNPDRDVNNQTAFLAARLLHEGMGYTMNLQP